MNCMILPYNYDDPNILWIHPDAPDAGCSGAYDNPFSSIESALERVKPGQTIVLMEGEYVGSCNIEKSGTPHHPIRICGEHPEKTVISEACWFFYDTSDLIVSDLTFINAPFGAVSLIGNCSRNRFDSLRFINCGNRGSTGCTFYMGGAGGGCNVVEACHFEHSVVSSVSDASLRNARVALMLAQGDMEHNNPILDNVIQQNTIINYDYGIIAGSDESHSVRCSHIIEYNIINNCSREGICVKSGDITVKGNLITGTCTTGITVASPLDCTVENNRIIRTVTGISLCGEGHTVSNNCIINCTASGIHINDTTVLTSKNCFIEHNTIVDCGNASTASTPAGAGIVIAAGTSGILQYNLFSGRSKPYAIITPPAADKGELNMETDFVIKDNGIVGNGNIPEGTCVVTAQFSDAINNNYTLDSDYGASGSVVLPEGCTAASDECSTSAVDWTPTMESDENDAPPLPENHDPATLFSDIFDAGTTDTANEENEERYWYPDEE